MCAARVWEPSPSPELQSSTPLNSRPHPTLLAIPHAAELQYCIDPATQALHVRFAGSRGQPRPIALASAAPQAINLTWASEDAGERRVTTVHACLQPQLGEHCMMLRSAWLVRNCSGLGRGTSLHSCGPIPARRSNKTSSVFFFLVEIGVGHTVNLSEHQHK